MKKHYYAALIMMMLVVSPVVAQTSPSPEVPESVPKTVTPTEELDDEVDKLKEKVAETVLGMKEKNDTGVAGSVKSISGDTIVLATDDKDKEITLDDTLTTYYEIQGALSKEIKKEAIKKNDYIFVLGPEISGSVTANSVYKDQPYLSFVGKITEANSEEFTVKIVTLDKSTYTLDVQTRTNQELLNIKTLEPEKIGFSKLKEGDSIHVIVKANTENPNTTRYDAERILVIPNEYFIQ